MLLALEVSVSDSTEGRGELRVAEFMREIAGERGVERRKAITLAGDTLDRRRIASGLDLPTGSNGSLRAITLERPPTSTRSEDIASLSEFPAELVSEIESKPPLPRRLLGRSAKVGSAALLVTLLLLVGFGIGRRGKDSGSSSQAAALSGAPSVSALPPLPVVASAAPPTASSAAPSEREPVDDRVASRPKANERRERDRTRSRSSASTPSGAGGHIAPSAAKVAAPQASALEPPKPAPAKKAAPSAWDTDTYGGRQ